MTAATIRRRVKAWQKKLLLVDWKIEVQVGAFTDDDGKPGKADCDAKPPYREAVLRFDPLRIPDNEWDDFIVHELLHVWTWPLEQHAEYWAGDDDEKYDAVRDVAEAVVTNLERVVLAVSGAKL